MQGRNSVRAPCVGVCPRGQKRGNHRVMATFGRPMQRRASPMAPCIDVCSRAQKHCNHCVVAMRGRPIQRRGSVYPPPRIDLRPGGQQSDYHLCLSYDPRYPVQRRVSGIVPRVDVGPCVQQRPYSRIVSEQGRPVQRRHSGIGCRTGVGPGSQQYFDDCVVPLPNCLMQRRVSAARLPVGIRPRGQQRIHHGPVSLLCRQVQ